VRNSITFILDPLIGLYIFTFALRLGMQWVRADFRNPIVQFVLKVTNPLVAPLGRFLPRVYKIDTATLAAYVILCWAGMGILTILECSVVPRLPAVLGLGIIYGLRLLLSTYSYIVIGYVILSWIGQGGYNPSIMMLASILREMAQPVMRPVQRFIPPIAGLDLSPIFLLIALQAVAQMLFSPAAGIAAGYSCNLGAIL
jgi:YggT family protein